MSGFRRITCTGKDIKQPTSNGKIAPPKNWLSTTSLIGRLCSVCTEMDTVARALWAVAGCAGRPRSERSERGGSRSPEAAHSAKGRRAAKGQACSHGQDNQAGAGGCSPRCAGGPGGGAHTHPTWTSGADKENLKEKKPSVAGPIKRRGAFLPKNADGYTAQLGPSLSPL